MVDRFIAKSLLKQVLATYRHLTAAYDRPHKVRFGAWTPRRGRRRARSVPSAWPSWVHRARRRVSGMRYEKRYGDAVRQRALNQAEWSQMRRKCRVFPWDFAELVMRYD